MIMGKIKSLLEKIIFWPRVTIWLGIIFLYSAIVIFWYCGIKKHPAPDL